MGKIEDLREADFLQTLLWSFCYKMDFLKLPTRGSLSLFYRETKGSTKMRHQALALKLVSSDNPS